MIGLDRPLRCVVLTVGRSDFSILRPLVAELESDSEFEVGLWAGGAHFDPAAGSTIDAVRASGLPIWAELNSGIFDKTPYGSAKAMANIMAAVGDALVQGDHPDIVVILGDRFEAVAVGLALVPYNIPVAHISGGSITEGAIDDVFRHCLSKMAAFHFCEVPEFARRIQQMGEASASIFTVGALGLDGVKNAPRRSFGELCSQFGFKDSLRPGYAVATLHPETRSPETTKTMVDAMIGALVDAGKQAVFTYPNADPFADVIVEAIEEAVEEYDDFYVVRNFGYNWFYTAMSHAGLVIGNSSSGIIEAASFLLPVVNIGERQAGRYCEGNVVHCGVSQESVANALLEATSRQMVDFLVDFQNPYGDGRSTKRIIDALKSIDWSQNHARKRFYSVDSTFAGSVRDA